MHQEAIVAESLRQRIEEQWDEGLLFNGGIGPCHRVESMMYPYKKR
jgi:hypothetical protein